MRSPANAQALPANTARRRENPQENQQESRKTALDAFRQIPYSRRPRVKWKAVQGGTAGSSRWASAHEGPHLGRAQACVCDPRSAMPQARTPCGALRDNLRAVSSPCATEPEGEVANVQSLPEKSSVLRPPGTQPFRGLFLRAGPDFRRGLSQFSLRKNCDSPRVVLSFVERTTAGDTTETRKPNSPAKTLTLTLSQREREPKADLSGQSLSPRCCMSVTYAGTTSCIPGAEDWPSRQECSNDNSGWRAPDVRTYGG